MRIFCQKSKLNNCAKSLISTILLTFLASLLSAFGNSFIYPNQGQSPEQQNKDIQECYALAKQQTNFDPTKRVSQEEIQSSPDFQRQRQQRIQAYNQALATCLKERGYTIR